MSGSRSIDINNNDGDRQQEEEGGGGGAGRRIAVTPPPLPQTRGPLHRQGGNSAPPRRPPSRGKLDHPSSFTGEEKPTSSPSRAVQPLVPEPPEAARPAPSPADQSPGSLRENGSGSVQKEASSAAASRRGAYNGDQRAAAGLDERESAKLPPTTTHSAPRTPAGREHLLGHQQQVEQWREGVVADKQSAASNSLQRDRSGYAGEGEAAYTNSSSRRRHTPRRYPDVDRPGDYEKPWQENMRPASANRSRSRDDILAKANLPTQHPEISDLTRQVLVEYAEAQSGSTQRQRGLAGLSSRSPMALLEAELQQCANLVTQRQNLSALSKVMRENERSIAKLHQQCITAERRARLLNMSLFQLRDRFVRNWRCDLTGEVLVYRYDEEEEEGEGGHVGKDGGGGPSALSEHFRSNPVWIEPGRDGGGSKKKKQRDAEPGKRVPVKYTEKDWDAERPNLMEEMRVWKIKTNELRHHVRRGTFIKNLHGLQPNSFYEPLDRKSHYHLGTAPDPAGTDRTAELRLDLSKEEALCRSLSTQLATARAAMSKRRLLAETQRKHAQEEYVRLKTELQDTVEALETAVFEEERAGDPAKTQQVKRAQVALRRTHRVLASLNEQPQKVAPRR